MNSKFILLTFLAIYTIQCGHCVDININQFFSIGRILTSDQKVVLKFGEIINLRNFYPLLSQFELGNFLNCSAKQLQNLASIDSCWTLYPQVAGLLNQTILQNAAIFFDKSPNDALNELKSSVSFNQFLFEKNVFNVSECLLVQILNPSMELQCLVDYPQLTAFLNSITGDKIFTFFSYFRAFLGDNFSYLLSRSSNKVIPKTETFSIDYIGDCLSSPNINCIQNAGLKKYFSSQNVNKLYELIDLSEKSLQSSGMSVPGELFESLRSALNTMEMNVNDDEYVIENVIENKSNYHYISSLVFYINFGLLKFLK